MRFLSLKDEEVLVLICFFSFFGDYVVEVCFTFVLFAQLVGVLQKRSVKDLKVVLHNI